MKHGKLEGKWNFEKNSVTINVAVMYFEEDGSHIAYLPALDLSGYGNSEAEAIQSLKVVLDNYFAYTMAKDTLVEDLKSHGWTIKKKKKPFIAPELTDLINKNEYLHDIVNTKPYRMDRMSVDLPEFA